MGKTSAESAKSGANSNGSHLADAEQAPSDAEETQLRRWLAAIAQGDEGALAAFYQALRPRLRRYLWRQLDGDATAIEDTLQEVFLAVWRSAQSYRGEARVAAWVFQIAHHQAAHAQHARMLRQRREVAPLEDRDEGAPGLYGLRHGAHDDEVAERLALTSALDSLSQKHRETLELVFDQGFSLEEVSRILQVPLGTVKSRLSYARQALLRALKQEGATLPAAALPDTSATQPSRRSPFSRNRQPTPCQEEESHDA